MTTTPGVRPRRGDAGEIDVIVRNGWIVDGSAAKRFRGDLAIKGDRIVAVGEISSSAPHVIDADGRIVAPGFIDTHIHSELALRSEEGQEASNRQGVTTHIVGQDGLGFAPTDKATLSFMKLYLSGIYDLQTPIEPATIADFLASYDRQSSVNVATLVPHGCVRMQVVGNSTGELAGDALEAAGDLIEQAMREGALGLSTGLQYVPSMFAPADELAALCRRIGPYHGVYVSHVRYALGTAAALREAIEVGRQAGVPVHISHLGAQDEVDWEQSDALLALVDDAAHDGVDVTFDAYPYCYASTTLAAFLPGWVFEGDWPDIEARLCDPAVRERLRSSVDYAEFEWSRALIAGSVHPRYEWALGMDVLSAAQKARLAPLDFVCELLAAHALGVLIVWADPASEQSLRSLEKFLRHPAHMLCSDGIYAPGLTHPRGYGAFARYVGRYSREGLVTLEEAVSHVTSAPARRFGLQERGLLRPGCIADLVVFDAQSFTDRASTGASKALAEGVSDVLISGVPVIRDGVRTDQTPARALRRQAVGRS